MIARLGPANSGASHLRQGASVSVGGDACGALHCSDNNSVGPSQPASRTFRCYVRKPAANCVPRHVGETATLCGWVEGYRDHGGLVFIDLRDRYGKTQIVFNPDEGTEMHAAARGLRSEYVFRVAGPRRRPPKDMINPKLDTGEIDLRATSLEILNKSKTPPFEPSSTELPAEELRLRYRFIDLRRPSLQHALILRHKITLFTREYFDKLGFLEIETPMLGKSTPEGARDYLVPSRVHAGCFYALPQSPQIYKQILMVAGYDRYMQIARCFRDEDLRPTASPSSRKSTSRWPSSSARTSSTRSTAWWRSSPRRCTGRKFLCRCRAIQLSRRDGSLWQRQARLAVRHGAGRHQRPGANPTSTRSKRPSKTRREGSADST